MKLAFILLAMEQSLACYPTGKTSKTSICCILVLVYAVFLFFFPQQVRRLIHCSGPKIA